MQFITLAAVAIAIGQAYVTVTNAATLEGRQITECIGQLCGTDAGCVTSVVNGLPCPNTFVCNVLADGTGICGVPV
ncbi:hypothetical protein C2E23DRAFT_887385 [Lenzites betulinus]|nr:hypothetical protein C2E23DRAFT_887385 [Lenzites betulinus]